MITANQLNELDWFPEPTNKNIWYYDSWEYEFRITSQELYYINDGVGEPEFIAKITDIEQLKETYFRLTGEEM